MRQVVRGAFSRELLELKGLPLPSAISRFVIPCMHVEHAN